MPRVVLMCGPSGSGKTTWARDLEAQGWLRLSIDQEAWRLGLTEHPRPVAVDAEIRRDQLLDLAAALDAGRDVVVDHASFTRARRDDVRAVDRDHGAEIEVVYLAVAREEVLRRVAARNREPLCADRVRLDAATVAAFVDGFEVPDPAEEPDVRVVHVSEAPGGAMMGECSTDTRS